MERRPMLIGIAVLVCALLLGGGMQIAEPLLGLPNSVSALGAPWLVCAFAVGALSASRAGVRMATTRAATVPARRGAVAASGATTGGSVATVGVPAAGPWHGAGHVRGAAAGAALLLAGTALYYAALVYGYGPSEMGYAVTMTAAWGMAAILAGGVMGALGALWPRATGRRALLLGALPAGALAGEAVLLWISWDDGAFALAAELLAAALLLGLLTWKRAPLPAAVLTATLIAAAFAGAEAELRHLMHAAGWHGA
jgi:hypothetical protein